MLALFCGMRRRLCQRRWAYRATVKTRSSRSSAISPPCGTAKSTRQELWVGVGRNCCDQHPRILFHFHLQSILSATQSPPALYKPRVGGDVQPLGALRHRHNQPCAPCPQRGEGTYLHPTSREQSEPLEQPSSQGRSSEVSAGTPRFAQKAGQQPAPHNCCSSGHGYPKPFNIPACTSPVPPFGSSRTGLPSHK